MLRKFFHKVKMLLNFDCEVRKIVQDTIYQCRASYLTSLAVNHTLEKNGYGITKEKYCDHNIVVSLTSHGDRIYKVYLTIESLMQQSMKPNRIVLWLDEKFNNTMLPITLQNQQKRGLDIYYVKDIGSYKKLIPSLKMFPESVIITVDDDALYDFDMVEDLVIAYLQNPSFIYCTRMRRMKLIDDRILERYDLWELSSALDVSPLNFPTGVGGVLYPPHSFNEEVFNEEVFMNICKSADDVWFKAMSLINGRQSKLIDTINPNRTRYMVNEGVQNIGLWNINKLMNDSQLKAVFDKYDLYKLLK